MISTRFITGTGFMKCIPMTLSLLWVKLASFVMEIELVLDAIIAVGSRIESSLLRICFFKLISSLTASITNWVSLRSSRSRE